MNGFLRYFLTGVLFFALGFAHAQLSVDDSKSISHLVNNVLIGTGIEADNIRYKLDTADAIPFQMAAFEGGAPYIGLSEGIILATGGARVAEGPNDIPTAHIAVPADKQLNEDSDLQMIAEGASLRDVAVLEFDFRASGDTLRFRYVFGSEEYNDHTCSPYNDVFGFFISGPGIPAGPFSNGAQNYALIPGRSIPVAINTVNSGSPGMYGAAAVCNAADPNWQDNSVYFVNNEGNPDPGTTQFDGFTVPMEVEIPLVCGEIYHIKIAIADAVDDKNDSAVFIEAGSFASNAVLDARLEVLNPDPEDELRALEGCSSYELHLSRRDSAEALQVALKAPDLEHAAILMPEMPEILSFEAGQGSLVATWPLESDGVHQGDRSWSLHVLKAAACGQDTAHFMAEGLMADREAISLDAPDSVYIACDDSLQLSISPSGGMPPYSIEWNNDSLEGFHPLLYGLDNLTLLASISDQCSMYSYDYSLQVHVEPFEDLQVILESSMEATCTEPLHLHPSVSGGTGDYSFRWFIGDSLVGEGDSLIAQFYASTNLSLELGDRCAETLHKTVSIEIPDKPMHLTVQGDSLGSCLSDAQFQAVVQGGHTPLSYQWRLNQQVLSHDAQFSFRPQFSSIIVFSVEDQCKIVESDTSYLYISDPPLSVSLPADTVVCLGDLLRLTAKISGALGEPSILWPHSGGSNATYSFIPERDVSLSVEVRDECDRLAQAQSQVQVIDLKADFTFNYDTEHRPIVNLSAPDLNYLWSFSDGSISTAFEPAYSPNPGDADAVSLTVSDLNGCEDQKIDFFDPPMGIYVPNAFTPDGDGLNDTFGVVGRYVDRFHIWIYDRWGNLVYESQDINERWNGDHPGRPQYIAGDNVYAFRYIAQSMSGEVKEGSGSILLLR